MFYTPAMPQDHQWSPVPKPPPGAKDLPYDDGEPMESEKHVRQMMALIESLETAWSDRTDYYIGGNMAVYYSELQIRQNDFRGPDVFVVLDTVRKERLSWVVWEEGGRTPDVVIELLSPSTEAADRGIKKEIYAQILTVGEYYLFDPFSGALEGYQLEGRFKRYRPIEPDADGSLFSELLGLRLGVVQEGRIGSCQGPWLRWLDGQGDALPLPEELARREAQRADQEAQRADQEAQRADQEAQRADQEAQRALALAEKLAAYEKKHGPLDG
jgi:Uma2 family endonuclease